MTLPEIAARLERIADRLSEDSRIRVEIERLQLDIEIAVTRAMNDTIRKVSLT